LNKLDLNLPPSCFLVLWFLLLVVIVSAALSSILIVDEPVLWDAWLHGLGQVLEGLLCTRWRWLLLGIYNARVGEVEVRALALTHRWRGGSRVVLDVLAGKGRLLAVVLGRGVGIRIRWRGRGGGSGLTAIGHTGCVPWTRRRGDA